MMNNPLMALMQVARSGGNFIPVLQRMAMNNPQAAQAIRLIQGKSPQQLEQIATNMAKERGVSINDIARQLGISLPSDR